MYIQKQPYWIAKGHCIDKGICKESNEDTRLANALIYEDMTSIVWIDY